MGRFLSGKSLSPCFEEEAEKDGGAVEARRAHPVPQVGGQEERLPRGEGEQRALRRGGGPDGRLWGKRRPSEQGGKRRCELCGSAGRELGAPLKFQGAVAAQQEDELVLTPGEP